MPGCTHRRETVLASIWLTTAMWMSRNMGCYVLHRIFHGLPTVLRSYLFRADKQEEATLISELIFCNLRLCICTKLFSWILWCLFFFFFVLYYLIFIVLVMSDLSHVLKQEICWWGKALYPWLLYKDYQCSGVCGFFYFLYSFLWQLV